MLSFSDFIILGYYYDIVWENICKTKPKFISIIINIIIKWQRQLKLGQESGKIL